MPYAQTPGTPSMNYSAQTPGTPGVNYSAPTPRTPGMAAYPTAPTPRTPGFGNVGTPALGGYGSAGTRTLSLFWVLFISGGSMYQAVTPYETPCTSIPTVNSIYFCLIIRQSSTINACSSDTNGTHDSSPYRRYFSRKLLVVLLSFQRSAIRTSRTCCSGPRTAVCLLLIQQVYAFFFLYWPTSILGKRMHTWTGK